MRVLKERARAKGRDMRIAVAGCVAQAEGKEILARAPAVDVVVGPQSYHRLAELVARARSGSRAVETDFPAEDKFDHLPPSGARFGGNRPGRASPAAERLPHRAGGLRQVLHLLRRALYARRRGLAAGGAHPRGGGGAGGARREGDHAARAERERLSRRHARGAGHEPRRTAGEAVGYPRASSGSATRRAIRATCATT